MTPSCPIPRVSRPPAGYSPAARPAAQPRRATRAARPPAGSEGRGLGVGPPFLPQRPADLTQGRLGLGREQHRRGHFLPPPRRRGHGRARALPPPPVASPPAPPPPGPPGPVPLMTDPPGPRPPGAPG